MLELDSSKISNQFSDALGLDRAAPCDYRARQIIYR